VGNVLTSLDERVSDLTALRDYLQPTTADAGRRGSSPTFRPRWIRQYRWGLVLTDLVAVGLAVGIAFLLRFATELEHESVQRYLQVGIAITIGWTITVQGVGGYEIRHLSVGIQEYKYIFKSSAIVAGGIAACCYMIQFNVVRGYVALAVPIGASFLIVNRILWRRFVRRRRVAGEWTYRMLVIGTVESASNLSRLIARAPQAGVHIVGACIEGQPSGTIVHGCIPVVGAPANAAAAAEATSAHIVAVAGSNLGHLEIRELGWQLEDSGRELVMVPGLTEVAGPRVHVSPVEGLPLMWVDQPQFTGLARLVKRGVDLVGAVLLLSLFGPIWMLAAISVKLTSSGPMLFRQDRLGIHGGQFTVLKLRSMYQGSEHLRGSLTNEHLGEGALFKVRHDPRVTPIGRFIRRMSIDELPQLINVIRGDMSLVGPRPLATIDSTYGGSARRRLLVRPGMTGLWQVSGRSNLDWEDAVRLDLYYVENWSLSMDAAIIARTLHTVVRSMGAY
jgi:exopolysaccharide biosynthesis polyprenyl glycosylphosphotransferase